MSSIHSDIQASVSYLGARVRSTPLDIAIAEKVRCLWPSEVRLSNYATELHDAIIMVALTKMSPRRKKP